MGPHDRRHLALQVALILLLSDRTEPVPRQPMKGFRVAMAGDLARNPRLAHLAVPADPTLFALSSGREFTGLAWKRAPTASATLPEWADRSPRTLSKVPANLGDAPALFLRSNPAPAVPAIIRSSTTIEGLATQPPSLRTQSSLRLDETLSRRLSGSMPSIPSLSHTDLLTNTVVTVTIDRRGYAVSASKRQGSGSPEADSKALEIVRGIRFAPLSENRLEQGAATFEWHTLPLQPAAKSSAP